MEHTMHLYDRPFRMVAHGYKTIDLRINDEKRQSVSIGDLITFYNLDSENEEQISVVVIGLITFGTFKDLYREVNLLKCGYTAGNVEFASPKDMVYYNTDEERKYGVVGICFRLLE